MASECRIAVYCVGNRLMRDDGVGPVVYDQLQSYLFPDGVDLFDLGCLTLDRIGDVDAYDVVITVDAVDGTGLAPGTIVRYAPYDMAASAFGAQSLHDLKLADLFAAAALLGYECEGVCFGIQVENATPSCVTVGLSAAVQAKVAHLVDCVLAELVGRGANLTIRQTGEPVTHGFHHCMTDIDPL